MSSPAPLLRPALGGSRPGGASRAPRLGLAIPASTNAKPVAPGAQPLSSRPALPILNVVTPTPHGKAAPYEQPRPGSIQAGQSASGGSDSSAAHSRSGSFGPLDGRASNPTSAGSQYSALSFASQYGIGIARAQGTPDPVSAVGSLYSEGGDGAEMSRDGSLHGLEAFDQLSLERGRTLDAEELDEEGWRIAAMEKRIVELGNLGEGAGGAVTKCKLNGGKTIFALKVQALTVLTPLLSQDSRADSNLILLDHHNQPGSRYQEADHPRARIQQGLRFRPHLPIL
jgi:mitogen-activated protein kinase kinase